MSRQAEAKGQVPCAPCRFPDRDGDPGERIHQPKLVTEQDHLADRMDDKMTLVASLLLVAMPFAPSSDALCS